MQCLLPLAKFKGNNFSHVLINRLSITIILKNCYSIPRLQHLYHSTKVCTYLGGKIDKNIPRNSFLNFFCRSKKTIKKLHFAKSFVAPTKNVVSSAKWPRQPHIFSVGSQKKPVLRDGSGTLVLPHAFIKAVS